MKRSTDASLFFTLGLTMLAAGIAVWWFLNVWIGTVMVLVAEILMMLPKYKLYNQIKKDNPSEDKDTLKQMQKDANKSESAINMPYKLSNAFRFVASAALFAMISIATYLGLM